MYSFKKFSKSNTARYKDKIGGTCNDAPIPVNWPNSTESATQSNDERVKYLARYGITCVPVDYFRYDSYSHTSLKDAIAEAKRASHH